MVDICDHGPSNVAVLAVSHADCEDLADRIRRQLHALGRIHGPEVTGPAWGTDDRRYAAGDRILVHVNLRLGDQRVHNGTAAEVTAVDSLGLRVVLDGGRPALLSRELVAGARPDGTPNVSHAWARTIDGAQGGTWDHVHLLATPNLDRNTLYVGQSRGRYPTHTWNTVSTPSAEAHGNVVVDPRTPDQIVLAAAGRVPDTTFAAWDDPNVLDRRLRAERAEHEAALAAAPPDRRDDHRRLAGVVDRLEGDARGNADALRRAEAHLRATRGPHLRRATRERHLTAITARDRADVRLTDIQEDLCHARAQLRDAAAGDERRRRWERTNQWRHDEIARIDGELGRHWTRAVLLAIDQDDPLAHGLHRLRSARLHLAREAGPHRNPPLEAIDAALAAARVERLRAIAAGRAPAPHLVAGLGTVPSHPAARDAWLGLAWDIETRLDRGDARAPHPPTVAERLDRLARPAPVDSRAVVAAALQLGGADGPDGPDRWLSTAEQAAEVHRSIERRRLRELDHGMELSL
ncbi:MAG: hypothetical protein ACT4PW_03130 [Acidimicrobiia bacterium]